MNKDDFNEDNVEFNQLIQVRIFIESKQISHPIKDVLINLIQLLTTLSMLCEEQKRDLTSTEAWLSVLERFHKRMLIKNEKKE